VKKITIIVILFSIVLVQNLFADESSHQKLAEELLLIMNVDKQTKEMFNQIKEMQRATLKDMGDSEETISFTEKMMDLMAEEMSWEKLKDDYINVYTEVFAKEELRELINFYKSPIGQKYVEKTPEVTRKIMLLSQKHSSELMPKIQKMIEEIIGKQDGITREFYDNGKLKSEWVYKNGEIQSTSKGYYETGELKYEYSFVNGVQEGITKEYDKNGKLIREWVYKNGEL